MTIARRCPICTRRLGKGKRVHKGLCVRCSKDLVRELKKTPAQPLVVEAVK